MLIRNCSLEGKTGRFNVRISGDKITEIIQFSASLEAQKSEEVFPRLGEKVERRPLPNLEPLL